ncbi:MAG: beta-galactosidase, partial [Candidatus Aminicenantes bacterium]|nr:beta-galactosidase [Candidatus Aminicenantes bacterium]
MTTRRALGLLLAALSLVSFVPAARRADSFGFAGQEFVFNGKAFQFIAGELHFQRIPREYWRDRLLKARAMGLNSICTYV